MNLRSIDYILAVAELGNFHRAAEKCDVSQPALSAAIKLFEERLGLAIFERSTRKVSITKAGKHIIEQAKVVKGEIDALSELAQYHQDDLHASFRIGAIGTIAPFVFPSLIACIKKRVPDMDLQIIDDKTVILTQGLLSGDLDAAVITLPFAAPGIIHQHLFDEPLVVVLPHTHPLAQAKYIDLAKLCDEKVLLLKKGNGFRQQIVELIPELANRPESEEVFAGTSLQTLSMMVAAGMGVTILPATAINLVTQYSEMTWRAFQPGQVPPRSIALAWRANQTKTHSIGHVLRAIAQVKQQLAALI